MIDIRNGELADLWPDETSPEFKSISYALHMAIIRMLEKAAGVGSSCDIDHLAESTLDYLAVETRAMYYDQSADIETKRSIIKNTLKWYTQAGTVKATEELIASVFGGDARLIEWFDFTEPPIEANTFDVETEALMTKDIINELTSVIKRSRIQNPTSEGDRAARTSLCSNHGHPHHSYKRMHREQSRDIRYRRNRRNERGSSRRTGYRDLRSEYHSRRRPGYGRSIYRKCNRH